MCRNPLTARSYKLNEAFALGPASASCVLDWTPPAGKAPAVPGDMDSYAMVAYGVRTTAITVLVWTALAMA